MGSTRRSVVIALAVAGLFLVAGVTYAASTVVSQPIGLTSEPATLGESLAPTATAPSSTSTNAVTTTVTTTTTVPAPTTTTTTPSGDDDDHGGSGHDEDGDDD